MTNDITLFVLEPPDARWVHRIMEGYLARDEDWAETDDDAEAHEVYAARVFARSLLDWSAKHV